MTTDALTLCLDYTGHAVRMVGTRDRPEWVAVDVLAVLGIRSNVSNLLRHFEPTERGCSQIHTPGGPQTVLTVTEPGLYRLIFRSDKPKATAFRRWVLGDVLLCIRRYGCWPAPSPKPAPVVEQGLFGPLPVRKLVSRYAVAPTFAETIRPSFDFIPLKAVPSIWWLPEKPAESTIHTWHRVGMRGVQLETARIRGRLYTSEAAVLEFVSRAAMPNPRKDRTGRMTLSVKLHPTDLA